MLEFGRGCVVVCNGILRSIQEGDEVKKQVSQRARIHNEHHAKHERVRPQPEPSLPITDVKHNVKNAWIPGARTYKSRYAEARESNEKIP